MTSIAAGPSRGIRQTLRLYIDAGYEHSMAIDEDGNFWVWGLNDKGQLGLGHATDMRYATLMPE